MTLAVYILEEVRSWAYALIQNMPGRIGRKARYFYWRRRFKKCGSFTMGSNCWLDGAENISFGDKVNILHNSSCYAHNNGSLVVGDRVSINMNVFIGASDGGAIVIGNDVLIGPNVVFRTSNHHCQAKDVPINRQGHRVGVIIVEDDVWIGANAVLLDRAVVRRGSVIAAGSVVNQEIPPYSLAGGVPAKVIQENFR